MERCLIDAESNPKSGTCDGKLGSQQIRSARCNSTDNRTGHIVTSEIRKTQSMVQNREAVPVKWTPKKEPGFSAD